MGMRNFAVNAVWLAAGAAEGCPPKKAGGRYKVKSKFKGKKAGGTPALRRPNNTGEIGILRRAGLCHERGKLDGSRTIYCGLRNTSG
jgi:hypothetical protein